MKQFLHQIPAIHELQKCTPFIEQLHIHNLSYEKATEQLRKTIENIRKSILQNNWDRAMPGTTAFVDELFSIWKTELEKAISYQLKPVINGTGTVLHTNLGRARLSQNAITHMTQISRSYSNLELTLESGKRGSRHSHTENLLKKITGAEAAMVVNNNAAAVYLILKALAHQKEVIVSRGQLVEIGGSFRISAIMEESGAILKEVGTTNKTHLYDYENALSDETAILMKVHTSNFKTIGFTKSVKTTELVELAKTHNRTIVYEDLGSGVLYDFSTHQIGEEPLVNQVITEGVDLVSFSGDKLFGGPQAGIIVGKKIYIDQLKKHQLARVLRVDKMTIAALEATLQDFLHTPKEIPVIRDLTITSEELKQRATQLYRALQEEIGMQCSLEITETMSTVGGGTMPGVEIPSYGVCISFSSYTSEEVREKLRKASPPILTRIQKEKLLIDVRTITKEEIPLILDGLKQVFLCE